MTNQLNAMRELRDQAAQSRTASNTYTAASRFFARLISSLSYAKLICQFGWEDLPFIIIFNDQSDIIYKPLLFISFDFFVLFWSAAAGLSPEARGLKSIDCVIKFRL